MRWKSTPAAISIEIYIKFAFLGVGVLFYQIYYIDGGGGVVTFIDRQANGSILARFTRVSCVKNQAKSSLGS